MQQNHGMYPNMMEAALIHAAHNGYQLPRHQMPHMMPNHPMNTYMGYMPQHQMPMHQQCRSAGNQQQAAHHAAGSQWAEAQSTPSRHLDYSQATPSPLSTCGRNDHTMPHHGASTSRCSAAPSQAAHYGRRLERELNDGSKEDLVKLIMDLCDLSQEVSQYVEGKAQIYALRAPTQASQFTLTNDGLATDAFSTMTPMKPQENQENIAPPVTPQSPLEELTHDLQDRHCTPEERDFAEELHPCMRMYTNCRYPQSCIFRLCPRNLCLHYLRGECAAGKDCPLVHRVPKDASPQILHMMAVCRGEEVTVSDSPPSAQRELFNASTCSDIPHVPSEMEQ